MNHESNGGSNGSARVTASGGSAWQYAYLWSNGATGPFVDGLTQGVYYVQVSDGVCSRTEYFQIFDVSAANSTDVVAAEYFFDTDPGPGLGYSLPIGRGAQLVLFPIFLPQDFRSGFILWVFGQKMFVVIGAMLFLD